jgi:hypothetical protein
VLEMQEFIDSGGFISFIDNKLDYEYEQSYRREMRSVDAAKTAARNF